MSVHLLWLWFWFLFGISVYMLKRSYYLVTGPNPIANNYADFAKKCWIPLFVRAVVDSGIYWATFDPPVLAAFLTYMGWSKFHDVITVLTQYGFFALFFGLGVDSVVDIAVTKIPFLNGWLPQMPPPLKVPPTV